VAVESRKRNEPATRAAAALEAIINRKDRAQKNNPLCGAPYNSVIDSEQYYSPHNGADEARTLVGSIPSDGLAEICRDKGSGNAEQRGDDEAAGVSARHEKLGDNAGK